MKVLLVCTGNLCRSPMAEGLLRYQLESRDCSGVEVASAGTWAVPGEPATDEAIEVSRSHKIDISSHRSHPLEAEEIDDAGLILGMTSVHAQEIASLVPSARSRTMLLKEMVETEMSPVWPDAPLEDRVEALLAGTRPRWRRKLDVADPIGRPIRAYERCFTELEGAVKILVNILCGDEVRP